MTKRVLQALRNAADEQKAAWDEASWEGGMVRGEDLARTLHELRVRADAYRSIEEMTFPGLMGWFGLELETDAQEG